MKQEKDAVRLALMQTEFIRRRYLKNYFATLELPLGQGQPRILMQLLKNQPLTQRQLSDQCGIDTATLSRALDRLEEAALVERRPSPQSRRAVLVALTPTGQQKAVLVQKGFEEEDQVIWQGFSETEMEALLKMLARIGKNLEDAGAYEPGAK